MSWYYKVGFGVIYTLGYFLLAVLSTGAGHGTFIFLAPVFTWVLVLIAIYLSTNVDTLLKRVFFVVCLLVHYLHVVIFLRPLLLFDIDPGTAMMWQIRNGPEMIVFITLWYLVGQLVIWLMFLRTIKKSRPELS
jgi:hypothetical protein